MDGEEYKKYTVLENILQKINQKYVALPEADTKRNNRLLQVIDRVIQTLCNKSVLFKSLYQNKFYGGSFYDNLRVAVPSEYDLDCLLCLPKVAEPTVVVSDKPGYVHIVLKNLKALEKKVDEAPKYVGLDKLLDGDQLSTKKVRSWMEGLMTSAITGNTETEIQIEDSKTCTVKYKMAKSGPAYTIKLEGEYDGKKFNVDIDLVPCFTFFTDQWPQPGYRLNPKKKKNTFFVVPKSPSEEHPNYWRLSFQEQERELISGHAVLKPAIKLIKKVRDRHQHKIASYFIKTVFLWEVETTDKNMWSKPLSFVFPMMLKKYSEYIEKINIPYYWNERNNLIADLSETTAYNIARKIKNIVDHIDKICNTKSDIYGIVPYLLTNDEVDLEAFKLEVPLSKKLLKQVSVPPKDTIVVLSSESPSSTCSSFEEVPSSLEIFAKLELLCLGLASEQKRIFGLLQTAVDKIESCETQLKYLTAEFEKKKCDDAERNRELVNMIRRKDGSLAADLGKMKIEDEASESKEFLRMVGGVDEVDAGDKNGSSAVDDLPVTVRLSNNLDFQL